MRTKQIILGALAILIVIACLYFFRQNSNSKSEIVNNYKINIGYLTLVQSLPHFVAMEKGYYKEEGLDVLASNISNSNQIAQDLVAGHLDVAINFSIIPLLLQFENAPNTAFIYNTNLVDSIKNMDGVLVTEKSKINKLEEISGKKLGVFPGTTAKRLVTAVFKSDYPNLDLPIFVELPPNLQIQSLARGDIDALFTYEPNLTSGLIQQHFKKIHSSLYADFYSPNPTGVGAVNANWVKNNSEAAKHFMNAMKKAYSFIDNNPQEARIILANYLKLDAEIANQVTFIKLTSYEEFNLDDFNGLFKKLHDIDEINSYPEAKNICYKAVNL